jgi:hypothetical protein
LHRGESLVSTTFLDEMWAGNKIYVISIPFHYNNGCTNMPECYIIRILPVLLQACTENYLPGS